MAQPDWEQQVLDRTKLDAVFLTNNFDDPLEGFDTKRYIPCLRTDDLVFHLGKAGGAPATAKRRRTRTCATPRRSASAIGKLFEHFVGKGARACAISLPPTFAPRSRARRSRADTAIAPILRRSNADRSDMPTSLANFVFWTLAEFCAEFKLPFDLMIGVNRAVYRGGVYQGQDLYDSRVSLIQYQELFNAFPQVTFPISVLASVTNQELVSYAWIFPERGDERPLVVLEHAGVHRARRGGPAGGRAANQADRLLQRRLQAGIRAAEVRDVQADPGQDSGRAVRRRPRLERSSRPSTSAAACCGATSSGSSICVEPARWVRNVKSH